MMASTRSSGVNIDEVGAVLQELPLTKLPLVRHVLARFFYHLRALHGQRAAAWKVVKEVRDIWDKTKIPRVQDIRAVEAIEQYYKEWRGFQKNKGSTVKCDQLRSEFREKLDLLFDISKKDAVKWMEEQEAGCKDKKEKEAWQEERLFYLDQCGARIGKIGGKDRQEVKKETLRLERQGKQLAKEQKRAEKLQELAKRKVREEWKRKESEELVELAESTDDSSSQTSQSSFEGPKPKKERLDIITAPVVEVLDAGGVSSRTATKLLSAISASVGIPVKDTNVNVTTVRNKRAKLRKESAETIKEAFRPDDVLTVHWDGKIVPHLSQRTKQDREAVIVSGKTTVQLLGAFAVKDGTAQEKCNAVVKSLKEWDITAQVKAMSFDTTATNSGATGGAATLIEQALGKAMLWLPCRHHTTELVIADVFHAVMGPSTSPDISIFKSFQNVWGEINTAKYSTYKTWKSSRTALDHLAEELIQYCLTQIEAGQPRADYLELLELCIIFLGGEPPRGVRFRLPGPVHSARWMAKAIYTLKMVLFRKQLLPLKLITEKEAKGLLEVAIFIASFYLKAWYTAPLSIQAPKNDLDMLKDLLEYEKVNKTIAQVAQKKLLNHMWYLSDINIGLAFYDERVSEEEKKEMVSALQTRPASSKAFRRKRCINVDDIMDTTLPKLCTQDTKKFFEILGLDASFLEAPVSDWAHRSDYQDGQELVRHLMVINDHAERSVKLMTDFNRGVTKNEESFQDLLINVQAHRKSLPDLRKETLARKFDK